MLLRQPMSYQIAAWLYILLHSAGIKNLTINECIEAALGDLREEYQILLAGFIEQLTPILLELNGQSPQAVEEVKPPLAESNSGENDGPLLESSSVSAPTSSGT